LPLAALRFWLEIEQSALRFSRWVEAVMVDVGAGASVAEPGAGPSTAAAGPRPRLPGLHTSLAQSHDHRRDRGPSASTDRHIDPPMRACRLGSPLVRAATLDKYAPCAPRPHYRFPYLERHNL
jgi:hypothetical protein